MHCFFSPILCSQFKNCLFFFFFLQNLTLVKVGGGKEKGIVIITFVTSEILLLWFSYYLFEVHLFAFFSDFIFIDLIHRNTQIFIFRQLAAFLVFYQYIRSLGKPFYIGENKSYFFILTGKQNTKYYQAKI